LDADVANGLERLQSGEKPQLRAQTKHVRISGSRLQIAMVERALYELEVARLAQKLGANVVAEIVKAPCGLEPLVRDRVARALEEPLPFKILHAIQANASAGW
jgi:hypothetical protein